MFNHGTQLVYFSGLAELIKRFSIDRKIEAIDIQKLSMIASNLGKAGYTLVDSERVKGFYEGEKALPNHEFR